MVKLDHCGENVKVEGPPGGLSSRFIPSSSFDQEVPSIVMLEPIGGVHWVCSLLDFGNGQYEFVAYKVEELLPKPRPGGKKRPRSEAVMDESKQTEYMLRAKRQIRHKVLMMQADRMLTLTTRACITDRGEFLKAVGRFVRLCRKQYGEFPYVCVLELQQRGAYHAHLALNRYYNVNILRHLWQKAIPGDGNVDMTTPSKGYYERGKIAGYLSKYLAKDIQDKQLNQKRYLSSQGIAKPKKLVFYMPLAWDVFRLLKKVVETIIGKPVKKFWESGDSYRPIIWFSSG